MAKILVIEDDDLIRSSLQTALANEGHQVRVAKDGAEGMQSFYQFNPNLVITNIVMPNKDGIEVIIDLLKFNPKLLIIAMAEDHLAISAEISLDVAKTLGAKGVLLKPFTNEELQDVVKSTLNNDLD